MADSKIYHITRRTDWERALREGAYRADSLSSEGFIHFSTRAQVLRTAGRFYKAQADLVLLFVDPTLLSGRLVFEDPGEGEEFPHLYGELNLEAVISVTPLKPELDGSFRWPAS